MNRSSLFILLLLSIFTAACAGEANTDEANLKPNQRSFPSGKKEIIQLVTNIQANQDTMDKKGPRTINIEGTNVEVTAYIADQTPVIIEAQYPDKQAFYYLKNNQVMLLRELLFVGADSSQVVENQFFYNQLRLLDKETRSAEGLEALQNATFQPLKKQEEDDRFEAEKVNLSVIKLIYGQ